jgi:hypothetical protein
MLLIGLIAGGGVGAAFAFLQQAALRRHQRQEQQGEFTSGWSLMPGAGGRIALLLLALVAIQVLCPMLFVDGLEWGVSGGVVLGYSWVLYCHLHPRHTL